MAEFALGMTKTAVEGMLSRVKSAIDEEGKQRVRVQDDLVFITGEFQMMQAFLNASSAGERASKDLVAQAWVRQVHDLAFDVENCIEFVVHLDKPSPWDWVQRLASSLPCLARPPLPLDEAVAEIQRLKARVEDVSQRNTRYNLLAGGGDNHDENQHQQLLMHPAKGHVSAQAEAFLALRGVWEATGKLPDTPGDLKMLINCEGSELKVISLWGSSHADVAGELGWASSLLKDVYLDPEIYQQFKSRACVKLADPFNPTEFLNDILTHFTSHHHDRHDDMSKLMLQVSQHKYLIILEQELSSVAQWEAIRTYLPDGNNGSRIIVSTKHLGVARVCTGEPFQVWELQRFSHDRYLCAIFPKGCGHRIGMGEFIWQLRRHPVVISLYFQNYDDKDQLMGELYASDQYTEELRIFDGLEFEYQYHHDSLDDELNLVDFAMGILVECYPKGTLESVFEEMLSQDVIGSCREFLTQHDCLIYVELKFLEDWDLIRQNLLCDSTRACIVVITGNQRVAKHCVGHQQYLSLNVQDLLNKGSRQQPQSGHADGGGNIIERVGESEPDELAGREDEGWFFRSHLPGVTMLSVWGFPGIGKSALVRQYYNYCKLKKQDYGMYGWVDVPHPFSLTVLCQRLLMDLHQDDPDTMEKVAIGMVEGQDPIQRCCKILRGRRCLLVIDDVWSIHECDLIKATLLAQANIGGKTIVITREESIARHCTNAGEYILNVKGLETEVALDLIKKITLDGKEPLQFPPDAEKISKLITSKCGGIPEVIVAIRNFARTHPTENGLLEYINVEFMRILDNHASSSSLRGLFSWMQSYFDACSDKLKRCIFYMSIFPAEQSIRQKRLLRRWIAEGYSSGGGGTAEEKAEKLLSEVMKLNILYKSQMSSTTRRCKVSGFFHEYIKSRPMEDNLVFELEGSCGPSSRLTGQHLTISKSWDKDVNVFNGIDLSRLRSLTVFGEWKSFLICDKMKLLRVLDLESTSSSTASVVTNDDVEMIGKMLPRLKFISLRGCKHITLLPGSFGAMRQLETLDVRHTSIVELPPAVITKLHKLQYIRAGTTEARRLQAAAAAATPPASPPTTPAQEDAVHSGTSPFLCVVKRGSTRGTGACKRRAHALVESKKWPRHRARVATSGGGVEVGRAAAEGIGKLTALHTLGVVNIAGRKCGLALLKELENLTQLRKLGLSGVNHENWRDLCWAISGHLPHLESLSLQLQLLEQGGGSYEFACFAGKCALPRSLKILKARYTSGPNSVAFISQVWTKQPYGSEYYRHEWRVSSGEDIGMLFNGDGLESCGIPDLEPVDVLLSLGDVPVPGTSDSEWRPLDHLTIDCRMRTSVTFGGATFFSVQTLNILCCRNCDGLTCMRMDGLRYIHGLKRVCVTGECSNEFKLYLCKQLGQHANRPELELFPPPNDDE